MKDYRPRIADKVLKDNLEAAGLVLIEGTKWCGKTTTASDTRYYVDSSIAAAALGLGPDDLITDLNTMGLLFETMCIRDLRVYADALDGEIYHYRDKSGLECGAVIHLKNGSYGLVEIKLGGSDLIAEGIKTLTKLSDRIDTKRMKAPSFKMILTGTGSFAYREENGILIVPIGALKP